MNAITKAVARGLADKKLLTPSTAHISAEDGKLLIDLIEVEEASDAAGVRKTAQGADLMALLRMAHDAGYRWLRLDEQFGDKVAGIPTFDW